MKAKRKPFDVYDLDELGIEPNLKVETVGFTLPQERQAGVLVDSVDALIDKLANEAKVI
jgi:electron transfer flavoprotein beta subunit